MAEPSVIASGVSVRLGGATLIDGVDFHAAPGELVGLLGPNGAGKSTLIRLLSGELLPDEGSIILDGSSTASTSPKDLSRARSVLGQHIPVDTPFTVRSIVEMGRHPHRHDPALTSADHRRAVEEAMRRTGVGELAARVYATLSSGERLMVFLARVLAQEAPIVLLDEPTANLDIGHSEAILTEAKALSRASHTVVSVFHDLNAAASYCDRISLLAEGRVRVTGSVREVLRGDVLSDVYRQKLEVVDHPFRDCPLVLVVGQDDRPVPAC